MREGIPAIELDSPKNLARIPTFKHWELNSWSETPNAGFGDLTPREYVKGRSWQDRYEVGRQGLRTIGVLKK